MTIGAGYVLGDRYRLDRELDGTGDRPVWVALDEWSEDPVLLALVPRSAGPDSDAVATRRVVGREVRIATGMRSSHVRRVLDVITDGSGLWVAARARSASRTLHEELDDTPGPTPSQLARWGRDAASGLADLHTAGLEHRNVRPALIAVDDDGAATLLGVAATGDLRHPADGTDTDTEDREDDAGSVPGMDDVRALGALLRTALERATTDRGKRATREDRARTEALASVLDRAADGSVSAAELRDLLAGALESQPTSVPEAPVADVPGASAPTVRVERSAAPVEPTGADGPTVRVAPAPTAPPTRIPPWDARGPRRSGPPRGGPGTPPPGPAGPPPGSPPLRQDPPAPAEATARTPRTRGSDWAARHRVLVVSVAIVVAVLVIVGLTIAGIRGMSSGTTAPAAPPAAAPLPAAPLPAAPPAPVSAIGDPRTANPCSLLSTAAFTGFGTASLIDDFGPFGSCTMRTNTPQGGYYVTQADFHEPAEFGPTTSIERVGDVAVTRYSVSASGSCRRLLALSGGPTVEIETRTATPSAGVDPCALADAGTSTALPVLAGRSVARRALDPTLQLSSIDACSLLDVPASSQVPGLDTTRRIGWFGSWGCTVGYNAAFTNAPYVNVTFTRLAPLSGTPVRIGRHSAVVSPVAPTAGRNGSCQVYLAQRSYAGSSGNARTEIAQFAVVGASGDLCGAATAVATAAEARLPAPG